MVVLQPQPGTGLGIVIETPGGERAVHGLDSSITTIGRAPTNGIAVRDHLASKVHAQLLVVDGNLVIADLESKNGTLVNGRKVKSHTMRAGDAVQIGNTRIRLASSDELQGPSGETRLRSLRLKRPTTTLKPLSDEPLRAQLRRLERLARAIAEADGKLLQLEPVAERVLEIIECRRVSIVIVEEADDKKPLLEVTYPPLNTPVGDEASATTGAEELAGIARAAKEPVAIDASEEEDVPPSRAPRRHRLVVPLRTPERLLGYLGLTRNRDDAPFDTDDRLVASIAGAQLTTFLRAAL